MKTILFFVTAFFAFAFSSTGAFGVNVENTDDISEKSEQIALIKEDIFSEGEVIFEKNISEIIIPAKKPDDTSRVIRTIANYEVIEKTLKTFRQDFLEDQEVNLVGVDFNKGWLVAMDKDDNVLMVTRIVLPRAKFYDLPVSGKVIETTNSPTWTPTPNMHKQRPGFYKPVYYPGDPGNAMGECKITMDFSIFDDVMAGVNSSKMNGVRIHGNAKNYDLGRRKSAGCIRIPDKMCPSLLGHLPTESYVLFFDSSKPLPKNVVKSAGIEE